jgi:hypothetical protein
MSLAVVKNKAHPTQPYFSKDLVDLTMGQPSFILKLHFTSPLDSFFMALLKKKLLTKIAMNSSQKIQLREKFEKSVAADLSYKTTKNHSVIIT